MRMREEKLEEQRLHQEERLRKALERAQADPKKRVSINCKTWLLHSPNPIHVAAPSSTSDLVCTFGSVALAVTLPST